MKIFRTRIGLRFILSFILLNRGSAIEKSIKFPILRNSHGKRTKSIVEVLSARQSVRMFQLEICRTYTDRSSILLNDLLKSVTSVIVKWVFVDTIPFNSVPDY